MGCAEVRAKSRRSQISDATSRESDVTLNDHRDHTLSLSSSVRKDP
jgi:hypothetical protein